MELSFTLILFFFKSVILLLTFFSLSVCFSAESSSIYPTGRTMLSWALNQRWSNVTAWDRHCFEGYLSMCPLGTLKLSSLFYLVSCFPNICLCIALLFRSLVYNLIDSVYNCDSKFKVLSICRYDRLQHRIQFHISRKTFFWILFELISLTHYSIYHMYVSVRNAI